MRRIEFTSELLASLPKGQPEAEKQGSKIFLSSSPCENGHPPVKITASGVCFLCKRESTRRAAEKRRRRKGKDLYSALQPPAVGAKSGSLTATNRVRREQLQGKTRVYTRTLFEATCSCGATAWVRSDRWGQQKTCLKCRWERASSASSKANKPLKERVPGVSTTVEGILWFSARKRAKKSGIRFAIEPSDISIPTICPILGIPLDRTIRKSDSRRPRMNAPSLDRLDSHQGYTPDNIAVMSYRANVLKKDGTADEHIAVAEFMERSGVRG